MGALGRLVSGREAGRGAEDLHPVAGGALCSYGGHLTSLLYFESALALIDVLDAELEQAVGISQHWYDALVHLEDRPE